MTQFADLAEVREAIDRLDRRLVPLIAERTRYVEQAARFKADKQAVVDVDRIEQVISKVRHLAAEEGLPPDFAEKVWRTLIEASILHEAHMWTKIHSSG